jgi:outer membrane protein assembly factor BamA
VGGILLRVIGGSGADRMVDSSRSDAGTVVFYDGGDATEVTPGSGTRFERATVERPYSWLEERRELDWGHAWQPEPYVSYDSDRGVVLAGGFRYDRYGFQKEPYASRIQLRLGYALGLTEPLFDYRHHFRDLLGDQDFRIEARWSGLEIIDFYGLGNESSGEGPVDFYRVPHKQVTIGTYVSFGDGERRRLSVGPVLQYLSTDTVGTSTYLATEEPYGSGRFGQAGLRTILEVDDRDMAGTPSSGYMVQAGATYFPEFMDVDLGEFGEAHAQIATYLSPFGTNPTLALRAWGKKVWGTFPFAEAAYLGGSTSLRGLREQRFAGDAAVLGSAELRVHLVRLLFVVPTDIGVFGLTDAGRVFDDGESSGEWHASWGGGIWLAPLRRSSTLQLSIARSAERTAFYMGLGFAF